MVVAVLLELVRIPEELALELAVEVVEALEETDDDDEAVVVVELLDVVDVVVMLPVLLLFTALETSNWAD